MEAMERKREGGYVYCFFISKRGESCFEVYIFTAKSLFCRGVGARREIYQQRGQAEHNNTRQNGGRGNYKPISTWGREKVVY
jgi:hypothetical protein